MTTPEQNNGNRIGRKAFIKGFAFIFSLVLLGVLIRWSDMSHILDEGWIDLQIKGRGAAGVLLFLGVSTLFTGGGLPRQIISFLGGYAYGVFLGTVLAGLGTLLGCVVSFTYARFFGRELIRTRFAGKVQRIDSFLRENPFAMALFIRLLPVGSNILTNLVAGVSSVRAGRFFLGSLLGYLPQTIIFALLGSGFRVDPAFRISLSIVLFVISAWWGVRIYRKYKMETVIIGNQKES